MSHEQNTDDNDYQMTSQNKQMKKRQIIQR